MAGNTLLLLQEEGEETESIKTYKFVCEVISSGRITVPRPLRRMLKLQQGQLVEIVIKKVPEDTFRNYIYEEVPPEATKAD